MLGESIRVVRSKAHRERLATVERLKVDGTRQAIEVTEHLEYRCESIATGKAYRLGEMRPVRQDPTDQPRARPARPHLQENSKTIRVSLVDHRGKIDRSRRLGRDGVGRELAIGSISAGGHTAVKQNVLQSRKWAGREGRDTRIRRPDRSHNAPC